VAEGLRLRRKLTTALLDRLAERATVITTKGKSYRMRKRGASDGPVTASEPDDVATKTKEAKSR
jgi:hypothetical protein